MLGCRDEHDQSRGLNDLNLKGGSGMLRADGVMVGAGGAGGHSGRSEHIDGEVGGVGGEQRIDDVVVEERGVSR
jgi:hypothetical protein